MPSQSTIAGDFKMSVPLNITEKDAEYTSSVICTDGVYLYGWDHINCALIKVGSGFHGSIAGNLYVTNKDIEMQAFNVYIK